MAETSLVIPTDTLKMLYNGAASAVMSLKNILIIVENEKIVVKHINEARSALMKFESKQLQPGTVPSKLSIDVSDLKTIVNLAKESTDVTFLIGDGTTVCKIGKTKKQFAQPNADKIPDKEPNFEIQTIMEFNDTQTGEVISTFSDLKEQGDLRIISSPEKALFKVEENNRSTEIEFSAGDLLAFSGKDAMAGYDLSMAISMFKIKQKGATLKLEFGRDLPVRTSQDSPNGVMSIVLAPKIYD